MKGFLIMLHVNSVNSVNSANSYSAVLPPSPMVFLELIVLTAPISQQCFQCVSCLKFGSKLAGNVNSMQFMLLIKIRAHLQLD